MYQMYIGVFSGPFIGESIQRAFRVEFLVGDHPSYANNEIVQAFGCGPEISGDFWAASEGLDDLIIRVGRMIAYQEFNTKSPLNGLADKWAAKNTNVHLVHVCTISLPST